MQAAGGSSGSDSINSTTVTADPIAVISTHILAGLQVCEPTPAPGWTCLRKLHAQVGKVTAVSDPLMQ